jgi:hypothetical protein
VKRGRIILEFEDGHLTDIGGQTNYPCDFGLAWDQLVAIILREATQQNAESIKEAK